MGVRVMFGNLTIDSFEKETKVRFSENDKKRLKSLRRDKADFKGTGLHIFQMPFTIVASSDIFNEVIDILMQYDFSKSKRFSVESIKIEEGVRK